MAARSNSPARHPAQLLALVIGAVYTLVSAAAGVAIALWPADRTARADAA
jgi:hypothetical protein